MNQRTDEQWVADLTDEGSTVQSQAYLALAQRLHRRVFYVVSQRSTTLPGLAPFSNHEQEVLARDFVQQALITIYQRINQYKGTGSFLNWASTVAVRAAGEELRKSHWQTTRHPAFEDIYAADDTSKHWTGLEPSDDGLLPEEQVQVTEMIQIVEWTVQHELSVQQRRAFIGRFVHELSYLEMAEVEGVEASVIYQRIHQARRKIKARLIASGYENWSSFSRP